MTEYAQMSKFRAWFPQKYIIPIKQFPNDQNFYLNIKKQLLSANFIQTWNEKYKTISKTSI